MVADDEFEWQSDERGTAEQALRHQHCRVRKSRKSMSKRSTQVATRDPARWARRVDVKRGSCRKVN